MNGALCLVASILLGVVLVPARAAAQNGTNYHVLSNGADSTLIGVGAGGAQTAADGLGFYVAGEDLRGSLQVDPDGGGPLGMQFSYRTVSFSESVCMFGPGASGQIGLRFPGIYFFELDGLNPNQPAVFTQPLCATPLAASFMPYGLGPHSTVSFLTAAVSALGPTHTVVLPDNGLVAGVGEARLAASVNALIPGPLASGCYYVQFFLFASALPFLDGIDGLWHYAVNSDDGNQYWQLSLDEMNVWQSNTVVSDAGGTDLTTFHAVVDYATLLSSAEANTHAVLAPHGILQNGPYNNQTENMARGGGPNFGFDVGRGSRAVSFGGLGGVKVPPALGGLGSGAQDPAYGPGGTVPTLGFVTWDGKINSSPAGMGSLRVTWISVDLAQLEGRPPAPGVTVANGMVRLPVEVDGYPQPLTQRLLPVFAHETTFAPSGWPHPASLAFGSSLIAAGGSVHLPLADAVALLPCNVGLAINVQYGSSGKNPLDPQRLTFDPQLADISGRKELYLLR